MKRALPFLIFCFSLPLLGQPNCEAYKYYGDDLKYKACKAAEKRQGHYQFSKKYQQALDEAIRIDSTFAFAYRAKSTAYLKSGDFLTWKQLMDKAVLFDPTGHLEYRGWCRYQFFRDYRGAIKDIERLDSLVDYDIGHSVNGDYHLHIARALCYKAIGAPDKAIEIIEQQLKDSSHFLGIYDYLHLGVLYLETGDYDQAIQALKKQEIQNDLAENRFYIALAYKGKGMTEAFYSNLEISRSKYQNGEGMKDPYAAPKDKIYLEDIEKELRRARVGGED